MLQNPLHTAEEMRQISNLAHVAEGAVLGTAALIALVQTRRPATEDGWRFAWPVLVVAAGAFLLGYLVVPHHGLDLARTQWRFVFGDPQQRQHLVISVLVLIGGASEAFALAGQHRGRIWRLAWPAALLIVGGMFVVHQQHGTTDAVARATLLHRVLGSALIVAGLVAATNVLRPIHSRPLAMIWPLALLAASIMLLIYREPEGAYHGSQQHEARHPDTSRKR